MNNMDSDAISDLSEVTSKSSSKKSRFSRAGKKSKDKSKDSHRKNQGTVHSVFGRGSKNSSSTNSISTSNGNAGNPSTSIPNLDDTEVVGSAEDVVAGITGDQEDPSIRFAGEGVTFKAKLIGIDPVSSPRGDAMCKNAMLRLKAIVKGTGTHKKKILLSISLSGLTLMDEKSKETISHHPIPLISYISRDTSDSRAFGFVYGTPHDGHQFIGIKTDKAAIPVMQTIADLFTYVYERRKKEKSSNNSDQAATSNASSNTLSFSAKEEFSEQKVNAAWSKSEPPIDATHSNLDSDGLGGSAKLSNQLSVKLTGQLNSQLNNSSLPTLLPPPMAAFRAPSSLASDSRTSTLSSIQRSDVLNELRSMRHVINSANAAAASNSSSSGGTYDRYATWESFQENEYSEVSPHVTSGIGSSSSSSQAPASVGNFSHSYESNATSSSFTHPHPSSSMLHRSLTGSDHSTGGNVISASDLSVLENRPSSARSSGLDSLDKASNSSPLSIYSSRVGVGQLRGPSVVPSPPSSPRSTAGSFNSGSSTMSKARARPRRGFEQPNQVALPPPSAFTLTRNQTASSTVAPVRLGSFSSTSSSSALTPAPSNDLLPVRPSNASTAALLSNVPTGSSSSHKFTPASESDLFAGLTFDSLSRDTSAPPKSTFNTNNDADKFEVNFDAIFPPLAPPPLPPPLSSGHHQKQQQQQQVSHQQKQQQYQREEQRKIHTHGSLPLAPPPPPPPPAASSHMKQVSFSSVSHASFDSSSDCIFPASDIFDSMNGSKQSHNRGISSSSYTSSSSSSSTSNADRYACFKEIQELANISSVFDQTSSGSDSDTFVGSPPSLMSTNDPVNSDTKEDTLCTVTSKEQTDDSTSLFDSKCDKIITDTWTGSVCNSSSINQSSSSSSSLTITNVPLSSANDESKNDDVFYFVHKISDPSLPSASDHRKVDSLLPAPSSSLSSSSSIRVDEMRQDKCTSETAPDLTANTTVSLNDDADESRILTSAPAKFKDTATSPGTPPPHLHSIDTNTSSHEKLHNSHKYDQISKSNLNTETRSTNNSTTETPSTTTTTTTAASAPTNDDTLDDPFGMKSLLQDLNRIDLEVTATFQTPTQQETATKGPDADANALKSEDEMKKIDKTNNDRPKLKQSNSISQTARSPLNITDRPPSTLSSTSSFRNPFTDDDDSEYATSTGATWNPFKHNSVSNTSTSETPGPFGQPAWPSMYDHRVYDHLPNNTPIICPSHAFHDQQSHIYYSHGPPPPPPPPGPAAPPGSASYVVSGHPPPPPPPGHPSAQVCAHGCGCQGYSAPPAAYACWPPPPPPPPHPMYCQMHPPGIPGHPQMHCVYCRSAAPAYHHTHHPVPHHPQSQAPLQPQPSLPASASVPQVTPLPPSAPVTESPAVATTTTAATAAPPAVAATANSNAPSSASRSQWPSQPTLGPTEFGSSFDFDDEPLSPPERNIFQHKDDPFADDDFFAQ